MKTRPLSKAANRHNTSAVPKNRVLLCIGLFIWSSSLLLACGPDSEADTPPDNEAPAVDTAPTDAPPADTEEPTDQPPEETYIQLSESDSCSYLTLEQIEGALSEADIRTTTSESEARSLCTYVTTPGEQLVQISVYQDDVAKRYLLNEYAQRLAGCTITYSFGTDSEEPTPFPADVEAQMDNSVLDIFIMNLEAQKDCGGYYETLPDFGANVYTFKTFVKGAIIGIASEDMYVTFVYRYGYDILDAEQSLEIVKELVKLVFLDS